MHRVVPTISYLLFALALARGEAGAAEVPAIVVRLAQAHAASKTNSEPAASGRSQTEEYSDYFFRGFTHPSGSIWNASEIATAAYTAGRSYWNERPTERESIFAGYGYTHVETIGVWSRGFEKSAFTPKDRNTEEWWLSSFGDVRWGDLQPNQTDPTTCKSLVRISGYMSPIGRYGHLGMFQHEFLAMSVSCDG